MSAYTGPPAGPAQSSITEGAGQDEVIIEIGGARFKGWETVSITKSCEAIPNSFSVSASAEFFQGAAIQQTQPGQACNVYIGQTKVITGWLDRRVIRIAPRGRTITFTGRGITRDLVDCSVDLVNDPSIQSGWVTAANGLELAKKVAAAYHITVKANVTDLGPKLYGLQIGLGDTPYNVIDQFARYAGLLVYEDSDGAVVLDQIGTNKMASGFTLGENVEEIHAVRSVDGRYSDYLVVWNAVDTLKQTGSTANQRAWSHDLELAKTETRLKIIVSEQITPEFDVGVVRANWEMARRIGRSQAVSIICDKWRDSQQRLWTPNWLAPVQAPQADIQDALWVIGAVTFRKDMGGTHTDLMLMPPEAFQPAPNPLTLYDAQLARSPKNDAAAVPAAPGQTPP